MTRAERHRRAQARYRKTAKGKATEQRYNRGKAHAAACARYLATERGKRVTVNCNRRRIFIGVTYRGKAKTPELAVAINTHVRARIRTFHAEQACR